MPLIGLIWGIARPLLPYILGVMAVMGFYAYAHHAGARSQGVKDDKKIAAITAERNEAKTALADYQAKQRDYAAKLVLDWNAARDLAQQRQIELEKATRALFTDFGIRSQHLPDRAVLVPGVGLLDNAIASAGADPATGPPAQPVEDTAPATNGALIDWAIQSVQLYKACTDQVAGWQQFYAGLRQ